MKLSIVLLTLALTACDPNSPQPILRCTPEQWNRALKEANEEAMLVGAERLKKHILYGAMLRICSTTKEEMKCAS